MSMCFYIATFAMSLILFIRAVRGDSIPDAFFIIPWMMFACGKLEDMTDRLIKKIEEREDNDKQ